MFDLKKAFTKICESITVSPITITPATNVTISVNNSVAIGNKWVYLYVKGHATNAIVNKTIFTIPSEYSAKSSTFPIFRGTEWNISSVAYGYVGGNSIVGQLVEGDWFHINILLPMR